MFRSIRLWIISLSLILCFNATSVTAAGPATHVALGQLWLAHFAPQYTPEQKQLFLMGTVFPDIRYLGTIKRKESHFKGVTLKRVMDAKTPFEQGMLFHSFVDEYRDKMVRKKGIEKKIDSIEQRRRDLFLKLIEDQIIHTKYDFSQFRNGVAKIPDEEVKFGIDEKTLNEWHLGLALYFSAQPVFLLAQFSFFDTSVFNIDPQVVKKLSEELPKYSQNSFFIDHVNNMIAAFEKEIQNSDKNL